MAQPVQTAVRWDQLSREEQGATLLALYFYSDYMIRERNWATSHQNLSSLRWSAHAVSQMMDKDAVWRPTPVMWGRLRPKEQGELLHQISAWAAEQARMHRRGDHEQHYWHRRLSIASLTAGERLLGREGPER